MLEGHNYQAPFLRNDSRDKNNNHSRLLELNEQAYNTEISRLQDLQNLFRNRCKEFAPKKRKSIVERAVELHLNYGEAA